jgi:hypothetical protein
MIEQKPILSEGLKVLSNNQRVTFTRYVSQVLPSDGFKFWVKASLLNNEIEPFELSIQGSFHSSINQEQNEDETPAITSVLFTTTYEIAEMQEVDSKTIWIGNYGGARFAFTRRGKFYAQAGLYHYFGDAIYPAFESQIIDDLDQLNMDDLIASNSLPFWLYLETIPLYPSYLIPTNLPPPYGSIHIDNTKSLQAQYTVDENGNLDNWVQDTVNVTLYGANNNTAFDFLQEVQVYCQATENMGITNTPTVRDEKRTQSDINAIAQKKSVNFMVNYHQSRIGLVIRRMLADASLALKIAFNEFEIPIIADYANDLDPILYDDIESSIVYYDPT